MSTRIPLYFLTIPSPDAPPTIRVFAWASFKSDGRYLEPRRVILDIGTSVSLIPFKIWGQCVVTREKRGTIYSLVDKAECEVGVTYGKITFSLLDEEDNLLVKDITIHADLCDTSQMPPLLGWHDFLEKTTFFTNYRTGEAWLEWPDESTSDE